MYLFDACSVSLSSFGTWLKQRISIYKTKVNYKSIYKFVFTWSSHQLNGCCSFFFFMKIKNMFWNWSEIFCISEPDGWNYALMAENSITSEEMYRWNVLRIKQRNLLCFTFLCCFIKNLDENKIPWKSLGCMAYYNSH